ncbi:hypothetical protein QMG83_08855 [Salinibacterium sp. G-O1]|uniref:hypothetical protein n=1 Tax=Salinibacterium sp. G-O1 TaxID=3046208 RepID=UPI0024B98150|nr:hypothetical protein [Salinibacterium sp. G-O1]MDJ0335330.1 hypothetical protein [Salinibacterium sp. G-O1]
MTHHWRPSDHLERAPGRSEWRLVHRGIPIGRIEYGRVAHRPAFRSLTRPNPATGVEAVVGYAWVLETACDRLWDWSVRMKTTTPKEHSSMAAWPWPPISINDSEWVVMRNSASRPKAIIRRMQADAGHPPFFRAVSWAPVSADRRLIGYFPTLELADLAILEDPPQLITHGPDKDRLGSPPQAIRPEKSRAPATL